MGYWSVQLLLLNCLFLLSILSIFASYMFIIFISSWWIDPFNIIKCSSLSLLTYFVLKPTVLILIWPNQLSWLLFACYIFFHPLTLNLFVSLNPECVSCGQYIVGAWFFNPVRKSLPFDWIHSHSMLLLIELDLHLVFYFMLSTCLMSFLFLYASFTVFFYIKLVFSSVTF